MGKAQVRSTRPKGDAFPPEIGAVNMRFQAMSITHANGFSARLSGGIPLSRIFRLVWRERDSRHAGSGEITPIV
jgi:hypothetical protein